jgi:hypothetical protein
MAVRKVGKKFRFNICHNEVKVSKAGGGTLVCDGVNKVRIEEKGSAGVTPD